MDAIQEFAIQELEAQTAMRLEMQILQKEVSSPVVTSLEVVTFFDKKKEYRSLSTFWENPVVLYANGEQKRYNSGEAAFHGEKYGSLRRIDRKSWRITVRNSKSEENSVISRESNSSEEEGRMV